MTQTIDCSCPSNTRQPHNVEGAVVEQRPSRAIHQPPQVGITTRNIDWRAVSCDWEPRRPRYGVWERRQGQLPVLVQVFWRPEQASSYASELVRAGRSAFPMVEDDSRAWDLP